MTGAPIRDLTIREVAAELRTTRQSVYNWVKAGRLPAYRISTHGMRIRREDLDAFKAAAAYEPEP